jgi:hypothetical protein
MSIVNASDELGKIEFSGSDGNALFRSAAISAFVSGTPSANSVPGGLIFFTTTSGSSSYSERLRITSTGFMTLTGMLSLGAPVTKTADFSVSTTENYLINNKTGSTCTVTLPAASSFLGRIIVIKNIQAQSVISASNNVVPLDSAVAGNVILPATAGKWAELVSDGTNWIIMKGN